jgi:hypothetical protein
MSLATTAPARRPFEVEYAARVVLALSITQRHLGRCDCPALRQVKRALLGATVDQLDEEAG